MTNNTSVEICAFDKMVFTYLYSRYLTLPSMVCSCTGYQDMSLYILDRFSSVGSHTADPHRYQGCKALNRLKPVNYGDLKYFYKFSCKWIETDSVDPDQTAHRTAV